MRTSEAETGGSEGLCDCSPIHPSDTATSHLLHGQVIMCFVVKILVIPEGLRAPCLAIGLQGTSNKADNYSTMKKANR